MTIQSLSNLEQAEKELSATHADTNGLTFLASMLIKAARYSQDVKEIKSCIERAIAMTGYKGAVQTAGELLRFEHLLLAVYRHRLLSEVELNQWVYGEAMPDTDEAHWEAHLGYSPVYNNCFTDSELNNMQDSNERVLANLYQYA